MQMQTLVLGDDCTTAGCLEGARWLQEEHGSAFEMKTVIAGHSGKPGVVTEAEIFNQLILAVPNGWEYKCDQRHNEIILKELQRQELRIFSTGVPRI